MTFCVLLCAIRQAHIALQLPRARAGELRAGKEF